MLFFLDGHRAQAGDYSKSGDMPPDVAGLVQRAANSPTPNAAA